MRRVWKWVFISLGVVIVLVAGAFVFLWFTFESNYVASNIIDFHPTTFPAKAEGSFFYSIGDELKYSDEITPAAPTIMRGRITDFLVSPDKKRIAAVTNGVLYIVSPGES